MTAQVTGRMGELAAELELLRRGWTVGNFNQTTANTAGYDLFAVKAARSVKIRVSAKGAGIGCFQWRANKNGRVFLNLHEGDDTDFIVLVSFDDSPRGYTCYVLPTMEVERTLQDKEKRTRERLPDRTSPHRALWLDDPKPKSKNAYAHGFKRTWERYREAWGLLEAEEAGD